MARRPDRFGHTPLLAACWKGSLPAVQRLLAAGADPNEATEPSDIALEPPLRAGYVIVSGGESALMIAARWGSVAVMRALVEAGASLTHADAQGDTALCNAVMGKDVRAKVRYLVKAGAKLDARAQFTPLYHAAVRGDAKLVRFLVELGAPVDARIWTRDTPLMTACHEGYLDACKVFLTLKADVNARGDHRRSPLLEASAAKHYSIVTPRPQRAKALAAYTAIIAHLVEAGAAVDARDDEGNTALILAAGRGLSDAVELLLARGKAKVDGRNTKRETALIAACSMSNLAVVSRLLAHGASVDLADSQGTTALMLAADNDNAELCRVLLTAGADASRKNAKGKTALDGARTRGRLRAVAALEAPKASGVEAANALYVAGKYREALAAYAALPAKDARQFAVLSNSGYAAQQLGRHADAVKHFVAATKLEPKRVHLYRAAAYSYWALKEWAKVERVAKQAVTLDARDAYSWLQLGLAHMERDNPKAAVPPFQRSFALDPGDAATCFNLGWALAAAGMPGYLEPLAQSIRLDPAMKKELRDRRYAKLRRQYPDLAALAR